MADAAKVNTTAVGDISKITTSEIGDISNIAGATLPTGGFSTKSLSHGIANTTDAVYASSMSAGFKNNSRLLI